MNQYPLTHTISALLAALSLAAFAGEIDPFSDKSLSSQEFASSATLSIDDDEAIPFLNVDQAFDLNLDSIDGRPALRWTIAPDYYLYHHSIRVFKTGAEGERLEVTRDFEESPALRKSDPYFGQVKVYYNAANFTSEGGAAIEGDQLDVEYQGCAESGLCYPTQKRTLVYSK